MRSPNETRIDRRYTWSGVLIAMLCALSGCLAEPRNNQKVDPMQINFNGMVSTGTDPTTKTPGAIVQIDMSNDGVNWKAFTLPQEIRASKDAIVDAGGMRWYPFSGGMRAMFSWAGSLETHTNTLKFRTYVRGVGHVKTGGIDMFDPKHDTLVTTFEESQSALTCVQTHWSKGLNDVIASCARRKSDTRYDSEITVTALCGRYGTVACGENYQCDAPFRALGTNICGNCGTLGKPPCRETGCDGDLGNVLDTEVCGVCGGNGEPRCSPQQCDAGLTSVEERESFVCRACGKLGKPACRGNVTPLCEGSMVVDILGKCAAKCGAYNQIACENTYCSKTLNGTWGANYICYSGDAPAHPKPPAPSTPTPPSSPAPGVGHLNEKCFSDKSCLPGLFCAFDFCSPNPEGPCNAPDESCCLGTDGNQFCNGPYYSLKCPTSGTLCKPY